MHVAHLYGAEMGYTKKQARKLVQNWGLRATAPRLAVLQLLSKIKEPISHGDVIAALGTQEWDPATLYRNLVKLSEVGLADTIHSADGVTRYVLATDNQHQHLHFLCRDCKKVLCLPEDLVATIESDKYWATSIQNAEIQLFGHCPECIKQRENHDRA